MEVNPTSWLLDYLHLGNTGVRFMHSTTFNELWTFMRNWIFFIMVYVIGNLGLSHLHIITNGLFLGLFWCGELWKTSRHLHNSISDSSSKLSPLSDLQGWIFGDIVTALRIGEQSNLSSVIRLSFLYLVQSLSICLPEEQRIHNIWEIILWHSFPFPSELLDTGIMQTALR